MEILNFQNGSNGSRKNRGRIATIVAGAFLVAMVGSTFAANITINSTGTLEYAQGVTQATACDNAINVVPTNRFINSSGSGAFYLETVTVTDTRTASSSTGLGNCIGKYLKIGIYNDTTGPLTWGSVTSCDVPVSAFSASGSGYTNGITQTGMSCSGLQFTTVTNGFALSTSSTPSLAAANIYKITIESHN